MSVATFSSAKTKRLSLILELAEKDVVAAANKFTDAKARVAAEKLKLDDILAYLNDYAELNERPGLKRSPEQMIRERAFIQQLSQAQGQQRLLIAQTERDMEHKKAIWQKAHLKQRAMQDLVKRMEAEELVKVNKSEEKLLDEWVLQQNARTESGLKLH